MLLLLLLLCCCFGPIKITLSNYLKPMLFCFSIIFLRTAERIFHRVCVSYKLEQNVCVLPLLLACFVALWLPYKYFCFSYVCFFLRSRCQQCSVRYLLLFVLMTIISHCFLLFELSHSVITSLCVCFQCLCVLTRIISPYLLS